MFRKRQKLTNGQAKFKIISIGITTSLKHLMTFTSTIPTIKNTKDGPATYVEFTMLISNDTIVRPGRELANKYL